MTSLPSLAALLAGILVSSGALACSCAPPPPGTANMGSYRFEQAQSIVRGRATAVRLGDREKAADGSTYRPLVIEFAVTEVVKGSVGGTVQVYSTPQFCGIGMEAVISAVSDSDIEVQIEPVSERPGVFTTGPCGHFGIRDPRTGQYVTSPRAP